nr:CNNM domain-containing protein [Gemmatimonadota bacterium]
MTAAGLLLVLSVFSVAALTAGGMAMRSVSRIWLRHWVEQQLRGSSAALVYLERPQRLIIAASATVAIILVLSGELVASDHSLNVKVLATEIATFAAAVVVLGQLLPRALARRFAPQVASLLSPLLEAAALIASPIVAAGRLASRRFEHRSLAQRDTIQDLLREGELEGVGEREEMEIITGVMQFGEKMVGDVLIPREEIFAISRDVSSREIAEEVATSAFSRVPVYDGSLDNVIGMIHAFDVLKLRGEKTPSF